VDGAREVEGTGWKSPPDEDEGGVKEACEARFQPQGIVISAPTLENPRHAK